MFEICTMTSSFGTKRLGGAYSIPESIEHCSKTGFDVLDLSLFCLGDPSHPLAGDNWERELETILAAKEKCGVRFYQTHPLFRRGCIVAYDDAEKEAHYQKMMRRSLDITAAIGAKWAVFHALNDPTTMNERVQLQRNRDVYDPLVEQAARLGIGIAIENMVQPHGEGAEHRYFSLPEEMIALCDDYNCPEVKICWDFGHGNTAVPDRHREALQMLGDRLVCVHVDDNFGLADDHLLPFCGSIKWEELMPVLGELNFPGVLDIEVRFTRGFPDDMRDEASRMTAAILRRLQAMI